MVLWINTVLVKRFRLRKSKGWTQVELAEQLNISDKTVSKWESEAGYPELTMFPLIADLFGVSIDYLMTGKEMPAEIITMSKAELCAKMTISPCLIRLIRII